MKNTRTLGHIVAMLCIVIWGMAGVFTKGLLKTYSPFMVILFRYVVGYIVLWIASHKLIKVPFKQELLFMGAGFTGITLYYIMEESAFNLAPASMVSVILCISPIITALFSFILLREEKITKYFILGFLVSVVGIALISFDGVGSLNINPLGLFFAFLAAVCFASYSIFLRKISKLKLDGTAVTRRVLFYGFIFAIPILFFIDFPFTVEGIFQFKNITGIIYLGALSTAISAICWNKAITILGPVTTSVYVYVTPVISITAAVLILHETVTWMTLLGIVLTVGGVVLSGRR